MPLFIFFLNGVYNLLFCIKYKFSLENKMTHLIFFFQKKIDIIYLCVDNINIFSRPARRRPRCLSCLPCTSCSIQVKVMAPSRLLSLKRSRKVPGHLLLSRFFSRSLLMKPMMELRKEDTKGIKWDRRSHPSADAWPPLRKNGRLTRRSRGTAGVA